MSGYIRQIKVSEGEPITAPTAIAFSASQLYSFADDAAYEAQFGAGAEGYVYFNTTAQQIRIYKNGGWEYTTADEIGYDNSGSLLLATDTQAALDELDGITDSIATDLGSLEIQVDDHEAATTVHGVSGVVAGTEGSVFNTMSVAFEDIATDTADIDILPTKVGVRMTGLTAIRNLVGINPLNTGELVLVNDSAFPLTIVNENGATTAANRIVTGTGSVISLAAGASLKLTYDPTEARWRVIGGTGSGSGGGGGGLEVVSISAAQTLGVSSHYLVDSSGGGFTLTLPDPAGFTAEDLLAARIVVEDSALATGDVGKEITVAPHSGGVIATNGGLQAVDETLVHDKAGWSVEYSWDDTLGHWKAQDYQGASGETGTGSGSGKNYILNPDGSSGLAGVSGVATTGSWSLGIAGTPSELPEQSVGSAFKISGSGLTVGDYVAWSIIDSLIDSVDGGRFGSASIAVKDISGTSSGEYSLQVYDVDNAVYVGDEVLVEGTGLYLVDVPLRAGGDYEVHLKAEVVAPTSIGVSGVTIEPVSQTKSTLGGWKVYTQSDVGVTSSNSGGNMYCALRLYKDPTDGAWYVSGRVDHHDFTTAATSGAITIPGLNMLSSSADRRGLSASSHSASIGAQAYALDDETINWGSAANTSNLSIQITSLRLTAKPTWADWDNTAPTLSDVQYENTRAKYRASGINAANPGSVWKPATEVFDTHSIYDVSTGEFTAPRAGVAQVNAQVYADSNFTNDFTFEVRRNGATYEPYTVSTTDDQKETNIASLLVDVAAGDTISIWVAHTEGSGGSNRGLSGYVDVAFFSEYSARKASLPISDAADETKQYLVPEYREATVVLTDSGTNLMDATLRITKIGNVVTITSEGLITHTSTSAAESALGVIPAWAVPTTYDITNMFYNDSINIQTGLVYPDGKIKVVYRSYAGGGLSATSTTRPFNVSYIVI